MTDTATIAETVYEIARSDFAGQFGKAQVQIRDQIAWVNVRETGTRLWLDTGDIDVATELWCSQFEALTTNNTLLNREVQKGIYDELVTIAASKIYRSFPDITQKQLLFEISFILNAYHALRLVELFDAHVSVELHTDLGNDIEQSVEYGKRYYQICPERFYIKVPLTAAGLLAARKLSTIDIPVNFTLGFSARQNYAAALIAQPEFANVFMGRLNAFVADNNLGDGENVGEKATLATQRELLELRKADKTKTQLIGASMRTSCQVASLAGLDVYTMPVKVAADYQQNPAKEISSQVEKDPEISLADAVTFDDFNASTLWQVPDAFKACIDELLKKDVENMTPADIQGHFSDAGFADFLPRWSSEDIRTVTADGKIPIHEKWKERLAKKEIGLDALMNLSAFYSFATDQKALDDRIESLL